MALDAASVPGCELVLMVKVVVIIEDKNACVWINVPAINVCRRQAADARSYNDQVAMFISSCRCPWSPLNGGMSHFKRTWMGSPHPGFGWRVVFCQTINKQLLVSPAAQQQRRTNSYADSIQKVTAGDRPGMPRRRSSLSMTCSGNSVVLLVYPAKLECDSDEEKS